MTENARRQPTSMSVTVARDGADTLVTVNGEIDLETSGRLTSLLSSLESPGHVNLDLEAVTYIDSTGLRALLAARDAARDAGRTLQVSATSNIVARLLEITGSTDLLER